jgi:hypothetical protein
MLYKTMTCALIAAVAANNAEVSTSNLRNGASFDNLKASWGKRFSVGDFDSQLDASYDYNANRDFLKDVKLSGNLLDGNGDDLRVGYEVTKNFDGGKSTELKLTAEMSGTKVCADLNSDDQLKEVSAQRSVAIGDRNVDVEPSFLVKAQTARVKLMSAFGKDRVKAQVDMAMGGENAPTYELGYERDLEDGRQVSATLQPANKNVDIELVDNKFEQGAVWTAKASVPLEGDAKGVLDAAKVSLKRAWTW